MFVVRFFSRVAVFLLTLILYSYHFYITRGADIGLIAVNADILQFIANRASSTSDLWVHFRASGLANVMFGIELFIFLYLFFSLIGWAISTATPARLPGSFPPAGHSAPLGHGDAHAKAPGAVMDTRTGGMRMSGGGSQI